jgi:Mce-associated membrane protein
VLLILAFASLGTYAFLQLRAADERADRDNTILGTARAELDTMANLRYQNARDSLNTLRDNATGAFLQQFAGTDSAFFALLDQGKVESTGRVAEAAVQRADDSSADVLVAVNTTVTNTEFPAGQARNYQSLVSLRFEGGRWLVSDARTIQ